MFKAYKKSDIDTTVLIVEDEVIIAVDLKERLIKMGYNIAGLVHTGEDAIASVEESYPDVVLMDIVLKGEIDGIQAAERINDICNVPIVFISAHYYDSVISRHMKKEPDAYLMKPVRDEEVHASIQRVLALNR